MNNLEQAARLALEAMEAALDKSVYDNHFSCRAILTAQIVALRAALAQQTEPVVTWGVDWGEDEDWVSIVKRHPDGTLEVVATEGRPVKQQAEPVVEPVTKATLKDAFFKGFHSVKLYYGDVETSVEEEWEKFMLQTEPVDLTEPNPAYALENCRLYAARHRNQGWAEVILRFCAAGGHTGSPFRAVLTWGEQAEPVAISDGGAMVIGWHALLNCDCKNDLRDDAIEALVGALHREGERQYAKKQGEPVVIPGAIPMTEVAARSASMPERAGALGRARKRLEQAEPVVLTDAAIEAAITAWFGEYQLDYFDSEELRDRMRAAIKAANDFKEEE
jgi:hypothetical protein